MASQVTGSRAAINLLANLLTFAVNILVGLWWVPFLVRSLGTEGYGMIPLATSLVSYMSLATIGLNFAVGTHLTVALAREDFVAANRIFNTSLLGIVFVLALLTPGAAFLTYNVDLLVRVPAGHEADVRLLFALAAIAFGLSTISSPFAVSTFSKSRFDLRGVITIAETIGRVGTVILLFALSRPSVGGVGWGMVIAAIVSATGAYWTWTLLTPELSLTIRGFDRRSMREILSTSGWMIVGQLGSLLFLNIDLLVINRLFGPHEGGRYAPLLQWSMMLRNLGSTVAAVFSPQVVALTARHDLEGLVRFLRRSTRLIGLLMALPIGFLAGMAGPLLGVWLGPSFAALAPLMALLLIPLAILIAVIPMTGMTMALNRVKVPGLFTIGFGLLNLLLAVGLGKLTSLGLYSVAAAGVMVLVVKEGMFTPGYAAKVAGVPSRRLYSQLFLPVVAAASVAVVSWLAAMIYPATNWYGLIWMGVGVTVVYCAFVIAFVINGEERAFCADRLAMVPGLAGIASRLGGG